ncbi:hypothetical protein [Alkalilimnicola ehrlichii]|uniref:aldose epimerase family protein n=1 Tax=Alkalilimnicola ehrlichii TaxID=351052 RepID=UPI00384E4EC5
MHPWFPRSADTCLEAPAAGVWEVDDAQLPTEWTPLGSDDPWNFAHSSRLPDGKIDNLFTGWNGRALLRWPRRGVALEVTAEPDISRYLVFSPGAQADFFCFEPVDHAVNAHNLGPREHGLVELHNGERHARRYRFRWVR